MLVSIIMCVLVSHVYAQRNTLLHTRLGYIQGTVAEDGNYFAFYGIPYGQSPAGENRFKAPTPATSPEFTYENPLMANNSNVLPCPQPSPQGPIGVEDCLRLSIFTNSSNTDPGTKPVLVWLIGEEYITSNPLEYSFKNYIEEDVIVVALNYRLSVLGFLCLGIEDAPGNAGLKDVVLALKWIREHINSFDGDPDNVVLFGHGSAAAMVDLVTLSPLTENLINKVIVHSGSSLAPWAVSFDPVGSARAYAAKIGFNGTSRQEMVNYLKSTNVNTLIENLNGFEFQDNTYLFAPCIENNELDPNNTFLADAPINILRSGNYSHVSFITGYTDREGSLRVEQAVNGQWLQQMQSNFTNFLPVDLDLDENVTQSIREFYFGQGQINRNSIEQYLDYHGDTMILVPVIRGAVERARTSRRDCRILEFKYQTTNVTDWFYPELALTGVPHGGILKFVLGLDLSEHDARVSQTIIDRYVSFAYTGVPTVGNNMVTWLPIDRFRNYVRYSGGMLYESEDGWHWKFSQWLRENPSQPKMIFWEQIYSQFYVPPTPVSSAIRAVGLISAMVFCLIINILLNV